MKEGDPNIFTDGHDIGLLNQSPNQSSLLDFSTLQHQLKGQIHPIYMDLSQIELAQSNGRLMPEQMQQKNQIISDSRHLRQASGQPGKPLSNHKQKAQGPQVAALHVVGHDGREWEYMDPVEIKKRILHRIE